MMIGLKTILSIVYITLALEMVLPEKSICFSQLLLSFGWLKLFSLIWSIVISNFGRLYSSTLGVKIYIIPKRMLVLL
jgi:hypothetical protein